MVENRLLKDTDKVSLTDGGQTSLHSHSGGGGGTDYKAGTESISSAGDYPISFTTSFSDANYAIILTPSATNKDPQAKWKSKTASGFTIEASQGGGGGFVSFSCDWVAIPHNDP